MNSKGGLLRGFWIPLFLLISTTSCVTFYQKNLEFNQAFEGGELERAKTILEGYHKGEKGKDRYLYYVNLGTVLSLMGEYEESNDWFEKAYLFYEDERVNGGEVVASFLVNPNVTTYMGEDQEHLYVLYFKAMNFMKMGELEKALVEVRRMEILLNQLEDRYKSDLKFSKDAFVHLLMGLVYDANGDANNAFIAYRNALEIYEGDYAKFFRSGVPNQLKKDLLRTARSMGFRNEVSFYEKKFRMEAPKPLPKDSAQLVLFWHNGLGPVKDEWSIEIIVVPGNRSDGLVYFKNEEFDILIPFYVSGDDYNSLSDLRAFRIAFPKYVERKQLFQGGSITHLNKTVKFEPVENINSVSFKVLEQRMLLEIGQAVLRVALKKAAEKALRENDNEGAAVAMALYSFASEKADTRNWQTLPHTIEYARMTVPDGENTFKLNFRAKSNEKLKSDEEITLEVEKGRTKFFTYHSLEYTNPLTSYQSGYGR